MTTHREEFVYVPHVDHSTALIAWGAFYLKQKGDPDTQGHFRFELLDDEDLMNPENMPEGVRLRGSIGVNTETYGRAQVRVKEEDGDWGAWRDAGNRTFFWLRQLNPNTLYSYQVQVWTDKRGEPRIWGGTPRSIDLTSHNEGICRPAQTAPIHCFKTFPNPGETTEEFTFAIIGDPGTGEETQAKVGAALKTALAAEGVRFVLTTGDNIYGTKLRRRRSGDEDDDWFASYFVPYRDVINRVPVFPCVGNHDSEESEKDDDFAQLLDNFFLAERFTDQETDWGIGTANQSMFYRFRFGRDVEFVAVDTSRTENFSPGEALLEPLPPIVSDRHKRFVSKVLADRNPKPRWRIPFGHHPPFSLGPSHKFNPGVRILAAQFEGASPQNPLVWFSGHEHNFQHYEDPGIHFVVSGAAGKKSAVPLNKPGRRQPCCHHGEPHFLLVTVNSQEIRIRLMNEKGKPVALTPCANDAHPNPWISISQA